MNRLLGLLLSCLLISTVHSQEMVSDSTVSGIEIINNKIVIREGKVSVMDSLFGSPWIFTTSVSDAQVRINSLTIDPGEEVVIDWGDGTTTSHTGTITNYTKNYAAASQYTLSVSTDDWDKITVLDLTSQYLYDNFSTVQWGNMSQIKTLILTNNNFSGTPPTVNTYCEYYNIGNNLFADTAPPMNSLCLEYGIYSNQFTGTAPALNAVCSKYRIHSNEFSGFAPAMNSVCNSYNISSNQLFGVAPVMNSVCQYYFISDNQFSGTAPALNTVCINFYIDDNQFTGSVPVKSAVCRIFDVNDNLFTSYDTAYYSDAYAAYVDFSGNAIADSMQINEIFEDADAAFTTPLGALTIYADGLSMGNLPDGASNTFLLSLISKFASAGKTFTYSFNTP